jgi:hypothetical protein
MSNQGVFWGVVWARYWLGKCANHRPEFAGFIGPIFFDASLQIFLTSGQSAILFRVLDRLSLVVIDNARGNQAVKRETGESFFIFCSLSSERHFFSRIRTGANWLIGEGITG